MKSYFIPLPDILLRKSFIILPCLAAYSLAQPKVNMGTVAIPNLSCTRFRTGIPYSWMS